MKPPLISVVVPVFNGAADLPGALDSLLGQTCTDLEIVIVDDGSTDDTPRVVEAYAARDARIRARRLDVNRGLITALNTGVEMARGPLIARQDADDISLPTRLELQQRAFASDPGLGVLGTAYVRLRSDGEEVLRTPPSTHTELRWRLLFENVWCHSTIMFRAELVRAGEPLFRDYLHAEDFELWGRLLQTTRGATLAEPLVRYREHHAAVSARFRDPQREMVDEVARLRMGELLGNTPPLNTVRDVKDCWRGRLAAENAGRTVDLILELFRRFESQGGLDRGIVGRLRSRWVRRLIQRSGRSWARDAEGRRALRTIMAATPGAVALAALARLLRR